MVWLLSSGSNVLSFAFYLTPKVFVFGLNIFGVLVFQRHARDSLAAYLRACWRMIGVCDGFFL